MGAITVSLHRCCGGVNPNDTEINAELLDVHRNQSDEDDIIYTNEEEKAEIYETPQNPKYDSISSLNNDNIETNETYKHQNKYNSKTMTVDKYVDVNENKHNSSAKQITNAFKNAVRDGNDSLVMRFIQDYPSSKLLQVVFDDGCNALHVAVRNKAYKLIVCLLTSGSSPNDKNTKNNNTALHEAVRINSVKIVILLTKFKADASIENNKHETPLSIAMDYEYHDIIELLSPEIQALAMVTSHIDTESIDDKQDTENTEIDYELLLIQDAFFNLKRVKTKMALRQISTITTEKKKLPELKGWLQKQQVQVPYHWQRRWIIVHDSYVLWSDTERNIRDTKNVKERQKFNNWINLMAITDVKAVPKGKKQLKFVISVGSDDSKNQRHYLWKCVTQKDRDYWVKGLNKHRKHIESFVVYLDTDS